MVWRLLPDQQKDFREPIQALSTGIAIQYWKAARFGTRMR
jgi:hypothetical protein